LFAKLQTNVIQTDAECVHECGRTDVHNYI